MTGAVRSIDCTNCGAGLDVLGGGRVTTQVCGYCGASLDADDAFRVLSVHSGLTRPASPFRLGMTGEVDGVAFTVIGTLGLTESWRGETWHWVDHMAYSPTHGYAWITVEGGHVLWTRKVRDWPAGEFLTAAEVERAEARPGRTWRMLPYRYYESSTARVDFAEGGFTYRAQVGDVSSSVSLLPPGRASDMLTYVERPGPSGEREVEVTRYAPELPAAFGADAPSPRGVHPLQPYRTPAGSRYYTILFGGLLAGAILLLLGMQAATPPARSLYDGPADGLPSSLVLDVSDPSRPARLSLHQAVVNGWVEYGIDIADPSGAPLAATARIIEYHEGRDSDGRWSEGSQRATVDFQPEAAGPHILSISSDGAGEAGSQVAPLQVTYAEGRPNPVWLTLAAGLFALAFLWTLSSSVRHRAARWRGSDWSDD